MNVRTKGNELYNKELDVIRKSIKHGIKPRHLIKSPLFDCLYEAYKEYYKGVLSLESIKSMYASMNASMNASMYDKIDDVNE